MKKISYLILCIILIISAIVIVRYLELSYFWRGYIGDVIAVMFIYSFFRLIFGTKPEKLAMGVFLFAVILEMIQYLQLFSFNNQYLQLIFGSTFDPLDLFAYLIGCLLIYFIDKKFIR